MKTQISTVTIVLFFFFTHLLVAQHQWVRTNPGGGGAIATVGATASGTILAASDLSGIYRSTDNGQTWDVVGANQGLIETHISSLGFDPNDGDIYFAGTYRGTYKTTDGGNHFTFVFPGPSNGFATSYIEDIAIAASNSSIGYLTHHIDTDTPGDVYKTTDGGDNWHAITGEDLPDNLRLIKLMIHPTNADIVYVLTGKSRWGCSEANLYRSTDGGMHWVEIGAAEGDILDMDLHPTDPGIVFISTFLSRYVDSDSCKKLSMEEYYDEDDLAGAFYKSTNGGSTFIEIGDKTGIISVGLNDPDSIRLMDILFPYDWNGNAGTWETPDGGTTWNHTGFRANWSQGYSENQYFAYAKSFNGLNKTVTKDLFNSNRYYGAYGQWAWGSFDGGITLNNISTTEVSTDHWRSTGVENINGHALEINESNPNVVFIGGYDIGYWYTKDHGASWTRTQPNYNTYPLYSWNLGDVPVPENMARRGAGSNVMTILNDPDRENVVWASFSKGQYTDSSESTIANTGLFKSTNYGEDWVLISDGLPAFSESVRMYGLSLDAQSPTSNRILFMTVDGNIYRSTNDGITWLMVFQNGALKFTEVDKADQSIVFAGGKDGLWRSTNGGSDWSEIGIPAMHNTHSDVRPDIVPTWTDWSGPQPVYAWEGVFDIKSDPNVPDRWYVTVLGPDKGLYRSDDGGSNWDHILVDSFMRGVAIAPTNSDLIYATSSSSYHSGGFGNASGVQFSTDGGDTWQDASDGMAFDYAGMIEVETGENPFVWTWSAGTGMQMAQTPSTTTGTAHIVTSSDCIEIYPNPFTDKIVIDGAFEGYKIEVFNSMGGFVADYSLSSNPLTIDFAPLGAGMYFISVSKTGNTDLSVYKILKE